MRHLCWLTAGLLATAGSAVAQYPYPYPPQAYRSTPGGMAGPPLSPYLNLLNGPGARASITTTSSARSCNCSSNSIMAAAVDSGDRPLSAGD